MALPWPKQPTADDSDEGDRQMILLAIAELALRRPGWDHTLRRLAGRLYGEEMFDAFKTTSADMIKPLTDAAFRDVVARVCEKHGIEPTRRSPIFGTNPQEE